MEPVEHTVIDSPRRSTPVAAHDPFDDGRIDRALELRARMVEQGERKSVVACSVRQGPVECATAEIVTIRVQGMG